MSRRLQPFPFLSLSLSFFLLLSCLGTGSREDSSPPPPNEPLLFEISESVLRLDSSTRSIAVRRGFPRCFQDSLIVQYSEYTVRYRKNGRELLRWNQGSCVARLYLQAEGGNSADTSLLGAYAFLRDSVPLPSPDRPPQCPDSALGSSPVTPTSPESLFITGSELRTVQATPSCPADDFLRRWERNPALAGIAFDSTRYRATKEDCFTVLLQGPPRTAMPGSPADPEPSRDQEPAAGRAELKLARSGGRLFQEFRYQHHTCRGSAALPPSGLAACGSPADSSLIPDRDLPFSICVERSGF